MIACHVYTPDGTHAELETEIVVFDAPDARRGIIPGHMPIVVSVEAGKLETVAGNERTSHAIGEGVLYFRDNVATFLVESFKA